MIETKNIAGGYISKISFRYGNELNLGKADIVVFVGPNNVGKSQCLRDLAQLCRGNNPGIIIKDITVEKYQESLRKLLEFLTNKHQTEGSKGFELFGNTFWVSENSDKDFINSSLKFGDYARLFVCKLDTDVRLSICNPPETIDRNSPRKHPIHYAAYNPEYRKWLSRNFKQAFKKELLPYTGFGKTIPLCIGDPVVLNGVFNDEQERSEAYSKILDDYPQVQTQGDGVRSFTGILLNLMMRHYSIYLIDEPEAFLHPPQAKIMGQIIGKTLNNNQQAFISTHSEEFIKGLLESSKNRIKIVRITRDENINSLSVLDNVRLSEIWNDPILKYSNIMNGLFHKTVVLCESDSDCKFYSIVDSYLKSKKGEYSEALFIHSGGKQRLSPVVSALRSLDIPVKVIVDIDILDNEDEFKKLTDSFGMLYDELRRDYAVIVAQVKNLEEQKSREGVRTALNSILNKSNDVNLKAGELESLRSVLKGKSRWAIVKQAGRNGFPSGDAIAAFDSLDQKLRKAGIFIVPVGELENFVRCAGGHGPAWVNDVLQRFNSLECKEYDEVKDFIEKMNI